MLQNNCRGHSVDHLGWPSQFWSRTTHALRTAFLGLFSDSQASCIETHSVKYVGVLGSHLRSAYTWLASLALHTVIWGGGNAWMTRTPGSFSHVYVAWSEPDQKQLSWISSGSHNICIFLTFGWGSCSGECHGVQVCCPRSCPIYICQPALVSCLNSNLSGWLHIIYWDLSIMKLPSEVQDAVCGYEPVPLLRYID